MSVIKGTFPLCLIKLLEKSKNDFQKVPFRINLLSNKLFSSKHILEFVYPESYFQKIKK